MRIHVVLLLGMLSIPACSTPHLVVNAKSSCPVSAKSNHLVMAAVEMEDFDAADYLAALTERALDRQGYRMDITSNAPIVVVTQAVRIMDSGREAPIKPARAAQGTHGSARQSDSSAMISTVIGPPDRTGWGGLEDLKPSVRSSEHISAIPSERLRVMIKAASMRDWMKAESTFANLPAIWTVTVEGVATPSQRTQFLEQAVDAASSYFGRDIRKPQTRTISWTSSENRGALAVAAHTEPDLTLDPLP